MMDFEETLELCISLNLLTSGWKDLIRWRNSKQNLLCTVLCRIKCKVEQASKWEKR